MQDFAKSRPVVERETALPAGEWKLDAASVLFGVLLGAIVVFAGLQAADYREMQPSNEKSVEPAAIIEKDIDFEFYEILKRDNLYSPLQNSDSN